MLALAKKMKGSFFIPVYIPSFALKLILGEVSIEVLKSATVSCEKLVNSGFQFLFPTLDAALDDLIKK
jgi:NAD dependent epimerase/dehydratase family enzyme